MVGMTLDSGQQLRTIELHLLHELAACFVCNLFTKMYCCAAQPKMTATVHRSASAWQAALELLACSALSCVGSTSNTPCTVIIGGRL
jgi:hypothetical protein